VKKLVQSFSARIDRRTAHLPLYRKLYLPLFPLLAMGLVVGWLAWTGLHTNATALIEARRMKELAVTSLSLLLTQDDASKALLLDMENAAAGVRKIEAYDRAQETLAEMEKLSKAPDLLAKIKQLRKIDETDLRPRDTTLLETMGAGKGEQAKKLYFGEYEPLRAKYEAVLREIIDMSEASARAAN
jgi:hypothetical protein